MKKFISYPSTPQFREIVGNINRRNNFVGLDEKGEAIYDSSKPKPLILFVGTVKLHGCFEKNTPIMLANGEETPISDIKIGDYVLTFDIENNVEVVKKITNTMNNMSDKEWVELIFSDRKIKCTEDHRFYTRNRGWVEAKDLTNDDEFIVL